MTDKTIPAGFMEDAKGALWPIAKIKPIDRDRHDTVVQMCEAAKAESARLVGFKLAAAQQFDDFVARSAAQYGVVMRGAKGKGNITLLSFDGRYKAVRQMADKLVFDERLQIAKELIDSCVKRWSKGSNANIKALVNAAFQVDKAGKINTDRVLGLRSLDIEDEEWGQAMKAINESIQVASTKGYTRYYERDERNGDYVAISLDVAAV